MIIVSIYGIIISEAGDIRFHFMLTLLVGFLYFVLYFVNLYFERKRINDD